MSTTNQKSIKTWLRKTSSSFRIGKARVTEADVESKHTDSERSLKTAPSSFFAVSMSELETTPADDNPHGWETDGNGDYLCHIVNDSVIDFMGVAGEIVLVQEIESQDPTSNNDFDTVATNVNPPLRRGKTTTVRLPRLGMAAQRVTSWTLSIKADNVHFADGSRELAVTPGETYRISMASSDQPLEIDEFYAIQDVAFAKFESNVREDAVWEALAMQYRRSVEDIKRPYADAAEYITIDRFWLSLHHAPPIHVVPKPEIGHLLTKEQFGVEFYWRKLEQSATKSLVTVKLCVSFGETNRGITAWSFKTDVTTGKQRVAGPFTPASLQQLDLAILGKELQKDLGSLLRIKTGRKGEREIHSTDPISGGWDSMEAVVFVNPHALIDFEDVITVNGLRSSFGKHWPCVFRVHQYAPPLPVDDEPVPMNIIKSDPKIASVSKSIAEMLGVGGAKTLLSGKSSLGKDIKAKETKHKTHINWKAAHPLFLNW